jgi:DnaJ-related protein SCJ1
VDEISLFIEKGIPDGHRYEYKEAADEFTDKRAGSIIFKVETIPDK